MRSARHASRDGTRTLWSGSSRASLSTSGTRTVRTARHRCQPVGAAVAKGRGRSGRRPPRQGPQVRIDRQFGSGRRARPLHRGAKGAARRAQGAAQAGRRAQRRRSGPCPFMLHRVAGRPRRRRRRAPRGAGRPRRARAARGRLAAARRVAPGSRRRRKAAARRGRVGRPRAANGGTPIDVAPGGHVGVAKRCSALARCVVARRALPVRQNRHLEIVELLLGAGAKTSRTAERLDAALVAAQEAPSRSASPPRRPRRARPRAPAARRCTSRAQGHAEVAALLLQARAPATSDERGNMPPSSRASAGAALSALLLRAGASAGAAAHDGTTPLYMAAQNRTSGASSCCSSTRSAATRRQPAEGLRRHPLYVACQNGQRVAARLLRHGAMVNKPTAAGASLFVASLQGQSDRVRLLLHAAADPDQPTHDGTSSSPRASRTWRKSRVAPARRRRRRRRGRRAEPRRTQRARDVDKHCTPASPTPSRRRWRRRRRRRRQLRSSRRTRSRRHVTSMERATDADDRRRRDRHGRGGEWAWRAAPPERRRPGRRRPVAGAHPRERTRCPFPAGARPQSLRPTRWGAVGRRAAAEPGGEAEKDDDDDDDDDAPPSPETLAADAALRAAMATSRSTCCVVSSSRCYGEHRGARRAIAPRQAAREGAQGGAAAAAAREASLAELGMRTRARAPRRRTRSARRWRCRSSTATRRMPARRWRTSSPRGGAAGARAEERVRDAHRASRRSRSSRCGGCSRRGRRRPRSRPRRRRRRARLPGGVRRRPSAALTTAGPSPRRTRRRFVMEGVVGGGGGGAAAGAEGEPRGPRAPEAGCRRARGLPRGAPHQAADRRAGPLN